MNYPRRKTGYAKPQRAQSLPLPAASPHLLLQLCFFLSWLEAQVLHGAVHRQLTKGSGRSGAPVAVFLYRDKADSKRFLHPGTLALLFYCSLPPDLVLELGGLSFACPPAPHLVEPGGVGPVRGFDPAKLIFKRFYRDKEESPKNFTPGTAYSLATLSICLELGGSGTCDHISAPSSHISSG